MQHQQQPGEQSPSRSHPATAAELQRGQRNCGARGGVSDLEEAPATAPVPTDPPGVAAGSTHPPAAAR